MAASHHAGKRDSEPLTIDGNATDDPSVLDVIVSAEDYEQLGRAMGALPFVHREVLLLRGTEGLPHRAVAEALGCSEGAARVRLTRALAALKREWTIIAGGAS